MTCYVPRFNGCANRYFIHQRFLLCAGRRTLASQSRGDEDVSKSTEEGSKRPNFPLWPLKLFLAYGVLVFSYKLLPLMSDSMVNSGFKLCQISKDSSFALSGLQRVRSHLDRKELCQQLFEFSDPANPERPALAEVLYRSIRSSNPAIQAEALALIEKVLDIWPASAEHLKNANIVAELVSANESTLSGETVQDTQKRIEKILNVLNKA